MFNVKVFPSFKSPPNASKEDKEVLSELVKLKRKNAALHVNFSVLDYRTEIPDTVHFLTYPINWITEYVRYQYSEIDPLLHIDYRQLACADWKDVQSKPKVQEMFYKFRQYGLGKNGLTVVSDMGNDKFGILGMTFDVADSQWPEFKSSNIDTYKFQVDQLCERYAEIHDVNSIEDFKLTPREVECLYWVAMGQTDDQIAKTLKIGKWSVVTYLKNAKFKLGAPTRAAAVARAISNGIIELKRAG